MVTKSNFYLASLLLILGISACKTLDLNINVTTYPNAPNTYTFKVEGDEGLPITNWLWDLGDSSIVKGREEVTHTYESQGEYVIKVSGGHGRNLGFDTAHVKVCKQIFDVDATINGCSTLKLTLPAGTNTDLIHWGDGSMSNFENEIGPIEHNYAIGGKKGLTVILNTNTPCGQVTWKDTITIGENAAAGFEFGMVGQLLDVKNITTGSTGGYVWDYGDGNTSGAVQGRHRYGLPGNYTVTLTAKPTVCTSGDIIIQSITIPPAKAHYLTEFKDRCECEANITIGAPRYYWNGYTIDADSLGLYRTVISEDIDIVNNTPRIQWDEYSSPFTRQIAIITSQRPIDEDGNFVGASAGDWMWTVAMDEGEAGKVDFSQGKTIDRIVDGTPIYKEGPPESLKPGVYFWMVYAINDNATGIGACSRVHLFKVP
jgi:PKD repeat protein